MISIDAELCTMRRILNFNVNTTFLRIVRFIFEILHIKLLYHELYTADTFWKLKHTKVSPFVWNVIWSLLIKPMTHCHFQSFEQSMTVGSKVVIFGIAQFDFIFEQKWIFMWRFFFTILCLHWRVCQCCTFQEKNYELPKLISNCTRTVL